MKISRIFILIVGLSLLSACSVYGLKNNTVTTITRVENGTRVVIDQLCELSISSLREANGAQISVDANCNVIGGAESLGANEKLIDLLQTTVEKIPSLLLP